MLNAIPTATIGLMNEPRGQVATLLRPFPPSELSDKLNVDVVTIYRWRTGQRLPRLKMLQKIADATGIEIGALRAAVVADEDARKAKRSASITTF